MNKNQLKQEAEKRIKHQIDLLNAEHKGLVEKALVSISDIFIDRAYALRDEELLKKLEKMKKRPVHFTHKVSTLPLEISVNLAEAYTEIHNQAIEDIKKLIQ